LRRLAVLAVFFLLALGLLLAYRFLVGGGRAPVQAPVNVSVPGGSVTVVDSDGDGIPDDFERVYGTDPYRPNYLLAYALGKLPVEEALLFKNVEDFNESSRGLVDLYASLPREKRESIDVAMLLGQILSDNAVSESERRLFEAKFVNPARLEIVGLNWTPTRVVLDKVYDINVTFTARDDKTPIAYAELRFIPVEYYYMIEKYGMRSEDYPKVFPPDKERVFVLTPVDGKFDSLEEKFSVSIKDIVGGREYRIVVSVRDTAGNERTVEVKTPYIRQFENVAKTDGIIVIADYYTWYKPSWGKHTFMPLLGEYDSGDPIVIAKHIDWATGHGIDAFAISWWGNGLENPNRQVIGEHPYDLMNFENTFLTHPMINQIKFYILYENTGRLKIQNPNDPPEQWIQDLDDSFNKERLLSDFIYFTKYFSHPQYLKIDGKPVVVFDYTLPLRGNITGVFTELRNEMREKGWELYLVNDLAGRSFYPSDLISGHVTYPPNLPVSSEHVLQIIENTDALSGSGPPPYYEMDIEKTYSLWSQFAQSYKKDFIPVAWPGFKNVIPRSSGHFLSLLEGCRKYNTRKIIRIPSFNEWYFAHQIEPAQDYSFQYLEVLKNFIEKYYKQ